MMNKGMKALKKEAPEVAKKMGYSKGGMHKMPDGTMMKGAKHGYSKGGMASRATQGYMCGGTVHKKGK